ncbi:MAG: hypothetical protein ACREVK_11445 [Gammaproteobacteria bacterium]
MLASLDGAAWARDKGISAAAAMAARVMITGEAFLYDIICAVGLPAYTMLKEAGGGHLFVTPYSRR